MVPIFNLQQFECRTLQIKIEIDSLNFAYFLDFTAKLVKINRCMLNFVELKIKSLVTINLSLKNKHPETKMISCAKIIALQHAYFGGDFCIKKN